MALIKPGALFRLNLLSELPVVSVAARKIHNSCVLNASSSDSKEPSHFLEYNKKIYPPQSPDETPRPAYVCHQRCNIKYSPFKMWYVACLVRGMTVDEAIKQLKFVMKKGAKDVRETIEEARDLAVKEHNVEFASNLWVAESFVGKGQVIKGVRRHARGRAGLIKYMHCHYFVRLEEGKPPKHYYQPPKEPQQQLEEWLQNMRRRKIINSI
ncbi:large ribosomal subunit protein uL22m [Tribolium castaneum]|uniref:Large ribosomal subunit protein uL22m n=1 Tax=Tribolium castaneum TaxID=7070 RepID=D2A266_TRICA|nr:PREDICTED: 39S ribosomal protein L22, mitochondrial [Tribolium castaneum]EFA01484.2 39S ribosomal protein L22, mitochondrial-like Protein [Tribolium castaneum]|eukprot:XP_008192863.1 PREDICTED: 39S ribosomal protein L22, mitochondrial [Tribolium castaneum]